MHYFWIYSVWIPGVAFLFGFQGKRICSFLNHVTVKHKVAVLMNITFDVR